MTGRAVPCRDPRPSLARDGAAEAGRRSGPLRLRRAGPRHPRRARAAVAAVGRGVSPGRAMAGIAASGRAPRIGRPASWGASATRSSTARHATSAGGGTRPAAGRRAGRDQSEVDRLQRCPTTIGPARSATCARHRAGFGIPATNRRRHALEFLAIRARIPVLRGNRGRFAANTGTMWNIRVQ